MELAVLGEGCLAEAHDSSRIAIVLPDLRVGGAERLHVNLAREFIARGVGVEFVLRNSRGELLEDLPAGATIHSLSAPRVRSVLQPLVKYLRERRPDAVLSAMWPLTVACPLAARIARFSGRVVVSEHSVQSLAYSDRGLVHRALMRASMAIGYRLASGRVGVSAGVAEDMARLSLMDSSRFSVVYNPAASGLVRDPERYVEKRRSQAERLILAVGNLKGVKRHDTLVRAFAMANVPGTKLCIVGEGSERSSLEALAASLGVADRVLLPGFCAEVSVWYEKASIFVLSSEREGFGNVLVEAMEHGVPVISTDCPSGPREILRGGEFGRLVPVGDVEALARAIAEGLGVEHNWMAGVLRAMDFSAKNSADAYLKLLLPGFVARSA